MSESDFFSQVEDENKDFGLAKVEATPLVDEVEDTYEKKYSQYDAKDNRDLLWKVIWGVGIVALLISIWFVGSKVWSGSNEPDMASNGNTVDELIVDEGSAEDESTLFGDAVDATTDVADAVIDGTTGVAKEAVEKTTAAVSAVTNTPTRNSGGLDFISSRTGRHYIVVGSFTSRSAAEKSANRLSSRISDLKIVSDNNVGRYRLTHSDYSSKAEARRNLNNLKSEFGNDIWVLTY